MQKEEIKRLWMQYYGKMYRVARTILYDEQESKDVVSDIFERLLNSPSLLQSGTEENYLLTSVRNQCIKRIHKQELKRQLAEEYSSQATTVEDPDEELLREIEEYVQCQLSSQNQRIYQLRFAEGRSYDEIAVAEGISKVAVWKHLSHIQNTIKEHFNPTRK